MTAPHTTHPKPLLHLRAGLLLGALALTGVGLGGCASRTLPSSLPPTSAASLQAPEAPQAPTGTALAQEPPLPGESTAGWPGLEPAATADTHGGHRAP